MSRHPGGEKARFGAERHVWAAQTCRSRASQLREAAGEVPRPLPAPLQVPARPARDSRSDESAGQGKRRRPKHLPGVPSRGSAPSSTSHRRGSLRALRAGSSRLLSEVRWEVFFCSGEREGAPGCWGALKELGELWTGVETLVVPWSLVRRPDLELAITYLFCVDWHTCVK